MEQKKLLVEVKDMCKNFGVTVALNHVDMEIRRGEIRGLIGENGSGKSTITSIIAGIQKPTSGQMFYKGKEWNPNTSLDGLHQGIGIIVQEMGTIPTISVAENIFLGDYKQFKRGLVISKKKMVAAAQNALEKIGVYDINPSELAGKYDMEQRKLIEIARTMIHDPEMFVVDETTTALSEKGREILYNLIHEAAENNKAVVFISHDLEEMMKHCDVLTVLRDGVIIDNINHSDFDPDDIKRKMIGREIEGNYYRNDLEGYSDQVVLEARKITTMRDILGFDLQLHQGEIMGIGGLSECGMHTLGRALYGLEQVVDGEVILSEGNVKIKNPEVAFEHRMGYVSKDRDKESLSMNASIGDNIASSGYQENRIGWFISDKKEKQYIKLQIDNLAIKCVNMFQSVSSLSGGNKQKVVFGKWIAADSEILILDCPTRGVDIGVKAAMYQLIYDIKKSGKSIILISEELPELCGMSDRILILRNGQISGEFYRKDGFDSNALINCMI